MMKESLKLSIKLVFIITVVSVLFRYFETKELVPYLIIAISGYFLYSIVFKGNKELRLEILCDALKYHEYLENKEFKNKNTYHLLKAYALFYLGNTDESKQFLSKVVYADIKNIKYQCIYYMLQLKYLFEEHNPSQYEKKLNEFSQSGLLDKFDADRDMFSIPLLIMNQQHQEAVPMLMKLIPLQKKRYYILEMEYYLALCYQALQEKDNFNAVIDFMVSKPYEIVYIYKCRKLKL